MSDRNPSPPPEIQEENDELKDRGQIGDTLFSQHWLFQALLKAIEYTERKTDSCNDNSIEDNVSAMEVDELPKDLEDIMCTLWDMSADSDVAHFLVEFKAKDIFLGVIDKTKSPRLLEIVTGILGNMAFYPDICDHLTENNEFVHAIYQLLGSADSPTIIQIIRLIHVCIASPNAGAVWMSMLKNESTHLSHLQYILENSLNGELLKSTLKFLYYLLDKQCEVFSTWDIDGFVKALTVSATQLVSLNDCESIVEYWHVLHLLSRSEGHLEIIGNQEALISQHLRSYVSLFIQNEDPTPPSHHVTGLAAAFATFNSLSTAENPDIGTLALLQDGTIIQYVKDLHGCLQNKLPVHEESQDPSTWEFLFDVLTDTISLSLQLTSKPGERQR